MDEAVNSLVLGSTKGRNSQFFKPKNINNNLTYLTSKMTLLGLKTATITEKGQIVIPKELRKNKLFKPGKKVVIIAHENRVELRSLEEIEENMQTVYASAKALSKDWNSPEDEKAWAYLQEEK